MSCIALDQFRRPPRAFASPTKRVVIPYRVDGLVAGQSCENGPRLATVDQCIQLPRFDAIKETSKRALCHILFVGQTAAGKQPSARNLFDAAPIASIELCRCRLSFLVAGRLTKPTQDQCD